MERKKNEKMKEYEIYIYTYVTESLLLYTRNKYNIINQLFFKNEMFWVYNIQK